jgi:hypothetical protein
MKEGLAKQTGETDKLRGEMRESFAQFRGEVRESFAQLRGDMRLGRMADRVGWLLVAASLLGVMARGFKWL